MEGAGGSISILDVEGDVRAGDEVFTFAPLTVRLKGDNGSDTADNDDVEVVEEAREGLEAVMDSADELDEFGVFRPDSEGSGLE